LRELKKEERKKGKHSQKIQSNFQVFSVQVMFKEEGGKEEKAEGKIGEEIFPEGGRTIALEESDIQLG